MMKGFSMNVFNRNTNTRALIKLLSVFLVLLISSCVGTIEDKDLDTTKSPNLKESFFSYAGLQRTNSVSNTSIELYFSPFPGNPEDVTYLIYVNNAPSPIEVKGSALELNPLGEYRYVVRNLSVNTLYNLKVGIKNAVTGVQSQNDKSLQDRTFSNVTASFDGVSSVMPLAGIAGQTTLLVKWIPAKTISSTPFVPRDTDPIAYELKYMLASSGSPLTLNDPLNPNVVTQTLPSAITTATIGSIERERLISGLIPGERYYVQVRAIHKSYSFFRDEQGYIYEQNTKFLSAITRSVDELFDFNGDSFRVETPDGVDGETRVDFKWSEALGPYTSYRIYTEEVALANASQLDLDALTESFLPDDIDALNANPLNYNSVAAGESSFRKTNLTTYRWYHARLVVCLSSDCSQENRRVSRLLLFRVVPKLATFSGVTGISNPESLATQGQVKLSFSPPVISQGVLTGLEVYCHSQLNDPNPVLVPIGAVIPDGTKSNCDGLTRLTANPAILSQYSSYSQIFIDGVRYSGGTVASNAYCISIIPVIDNSSYTNRDTTQAVVRCERPEIVVPSITEFPGALSGCTVTSETLTVRWTAPTGGIYSNFQVFWKEINGSQPFRFSGATNSEAGYFNNESFGGPLGIGSNQYIITGLQAGKRYQFGVLAYANIINSQTATLEKNFSESNSGIRDCQLTLPVADFDEWIHIAAVGPKENGLVRPASAERFLVETLDKDGLPIEIEYDPTTFSPTNLFNAQFGVRSGSREFEGVYGTINADPNRAEKHMYSNSGIIQIAWKDVNIITDTTQRLKNRTPAGDISGTKPLRKFGYKVYRSSDGMFSWQELTSANYSFQTATNAGLVHAAEYSERSRVNVSPDVFDAIIFTDYSVQAFDFRNPSVSVKGDHDRIDRARVYYYRVAPVFDGRELNYTDSSASSPQNIIKVTLPPRNNALVHRLISNRMTCKELGKPYIKNTNSHYSCEYDGLGSRGAEIPWRSDSTLNDLGGDVIVDRFEMGCDISRGDLENRDSVFTPAATDRPTDGEKNTFRSYDFKGFSGGASFQGCLMTGAELDPGDLNFNRFRPMSPGQIFRPDISPEAGEPYENASSIYRGDCFGSDFLNLSQFSSVCPGDNLNTISFRFLYPGARPSNGYMLGDQYACTEAVNLPINYFTLFNDDFRYFSFQNTVAQSEYAGVYFTNHMGSGPGTIGTSSFRSGQSAPASSSRLSIVNNDPSSCFVNLPVQDNSVTVHGEGRIKPRWIPANKLNRINYHNDSGAITSTIDLLDMTIDEITSDLRLYDNTSVHAHNNIPPDETTNSYLKPAFKWGGSVPRITNQTPLARIISSNAAKLPPIDGLGRDDYAQICNSYQVEVGQVDSSGEYFVLEPARGKNLMRRKEFVAAAAWPSSFDNTKVVNLERGTYTEEPEDSEGDNVLTLNGACNSELKPGNALINSSLGIASPLDPRVYDITTNSAYFTGSSAQDSLFNTQKCQSRFGIQDLVGNKGETGTDIFFCNYSEERMMIGPINDTLLSIQAGSTDITVDESLNVWTLGTANSGRCSPVSVGADRPWNPVESGPAPRAFEVNGFMANVFDAFGNINTNFILQPWSFDQAGVEQLRNGDGYFLDFGTTGIAPPLDTIDTVALRAPTRPSNYRSELGTDTKRGKFFNPILGIPLECNGDSCNFSRDNKLVSTSLLVPDPDDLDAEVQIEDFPIGNSQILSVGLAERRLVQSYTTMNLTSSHPYTYIESIHPGLVPDRTFRTRNTMDVDALQTAIRWTFELTRESRVGFHNGGHSKSGGNGRYTTSILGSLSDTGNKSESAARCSILINR